MGKPCPVLDSTDAGCWMQRKLESSESEVKGKGGWIQDPVSSIKYPCRVSPADPDLTNGVLRGISEATAALS
jgi:hypothetical protein